MQSIGPFQVSIIKHQVLTQYFRWFQVYERPVNERRYLNQLEILSDEVIIESAAGTSSGKTQLKERLDKFEGWLNAHHVNKTVIEVLDDGTFSLEADILYQNIRPDKSRFSYTIHYSAVLNNMEKELPVFKSLKIKPTGEGDATVFEDTYNENRAKAFMHYWCYCLESSHCDSIKFKELLAEDFILELSEGRVAHNFDEFDTWLASTRNKIIQSAHDPKNFTVTVNKDNSISVKVDFDWQGMNNNNEAMHAETRHEWLLINDMDERFARLKHMKVIQLQLFSVINSK